MATKVAILGGGPAGLSTAFWLTATPQLRQRFEVTIYTPGWRIGGKCASGREEGRILEHGLHILMGCYRNVFATMCACYDEWQPPPASPFRKWADAVTPQYQVSLPEQQADGSWDWWNLPIPPNEKPLCGGGKAPDLWELLVALSEWVERKLLEHDPFLGGDVSATLEEFRTLIKTQPDATQVEQAVTRLLHLQASVPPLTASFAGRRESTVSAFDATADADAPSAPPSFPPGALRVLLDLGVAAMIGVLRAIWQPNGLAKLDDLDFRAWLAANGAHPASLRSAPIRALYDLTFAFPDGDAADIDKGRIAAGVTLRFALEATLAYVGAPLWKMNAGTGDTLFTPLYQVLQARGVKFQFFHRVEDMALGADGRIAHITLAQQAELKAAPYRPLVPVMDLECWPSEPLWDQLENGRVLQQEGIDFESSGDTTAVRLVTLVAGTDFDLAVLATPPDITRTIAQGLQGADQRWDAMLAHSASVATAAFQLWLKPPLQDLGWERGSTVLTAYEAPYESWADMSHLLPREPPSEARTLAYFCGCTPDGVLPIAHVGMAAWLHEHIGVLWPLAGELADAQGELDEAAIVHSYARHNLFGSERYVLTPPGSVKYRLSPSEPVFRNLYVAGDWTATRFSGGCVEAAFESGVLAARAIATL